MKRLFLLLTALALLCALAAPAAADVAYMPRDSFIEKHWDECRYENRWYWTNGPEGYVLARKTPDSAEATPLPNGGKYYVSNVYKGEWGVLEYDKDTLTNNLGSASVSGWVRMSEMVADYDNAAFEADHGADFSPGQAELTLEYSDVAYGYKYPGSGIVVDELSGQYYNREPLQLSPLFIDPAGRTWGYLDYYYGRHDCWICIDDPGNDALAPDENCVTIVTTAAQPAPTPPEAPVPTAAPTQEPVPAPIEEPDPTPSAAPAEAPGPTEAPAVAPSETPDKPTAPPETPAPAPTEAPAGTPASAATPAPSGKTIELTSPADAETLRQAAKANRGNGPYLVAGAVGVVIVAAAVLVAALRKKKK